MNCKNCGGVLTLLPDREYLQCEFCQAITFLKESSDGVVPIGQHTELSCPVCRRGLVTASIAGREVLRCASCDGVLLYQEDFLPILRARIEGSDSPRQRARPLRPEDRRRLLRCPMCDGPFALHPYYGPGNVLIDTCGECRLIWLDRGEIATIVAAAQRERSR
jgi:Zn-finger nucleic acid-binding protein